VAEALHDLEQEGVTLVETHASQPNTPAMKLFEKLGFETAEFGTLFRRP
jgi:ribosomal protein S18 acetylase RimI-like enzyme